MIGGTAGLQVAAATASRALMPPSAPSYLAKRSKSIVRLKPPRVPGQRFFVKRGTRKPRTRACTAAALPLVIGRVLVRDMRLYFATESTIKSDEIAARPHYAIERRKGGSNARSSGFCRFDRKRNAG